jgi:hypothetical protein
MKLFPNVCGFPYNPYKGERGFHYVVFLGLRFNEQVKVLQKTVSLALALAPAFVLSIQ